MDKRVQEYIERNVLIKIYKLDTLVRRYIVVECTVFSKVEQSVSPDDTIT